MVQPAPRITRAPVKNRAVVDRMETGVAKGVAMVAARRVLKRHGKKR
jgi:hypothetical protein